MLTEIKEGIKKTLKHLNLEYSKLQLGRANPMILESIMVEQYGSMQPMKNLATVSNIDSQTLSIKPWDKTVLHSIAKAISESGLGLNPQSMSDSIMIKIPQLTEERRVEISKIAKTIAEDAKIGIRNSRAESMKNIKKAEDNKEISEDQKKDFENDLQKLINDANKEIEESYKNKDIEIMKI